MVVDHRALNKLVCATCKQTNKLTIKNRFPLPRIDDLFDKLQGPQYFTSLDAASGFHQILLQESDRPKTAFRTPFGHYQFRVLPFGLTNAPATFQAVMNRVFEHPKFLADGKVNPLAAISVFVVFIDDILISVKLLKSMLSMSNLSWTYCARTLYSSKCLNAHGARLHCLIWATPGQRWHQS